MNKCTDAAVAWIQERIVEDTLREVVGLINKAELLFELNSEEVDYLFEVV